MATINPYLSFKGNCEEAFDFYKSVFGGEYSYLGRFKDMPSDEPIPDSVKEKIMHISLPVSKETILMGSDTLEEFGQNVEVGNNISILIDTQSEDEAKELFDKLSKDGKITMPLEKSFWGALFGMCVDKYEINWMVSYEYKQ